MCKRLLLIVLFIIIHGNLNAKEPIIGTLININSNEIQDFKIGNYKFSCKPYGVITLEELYRTSNDGSSCRKAISKFYKKRINLKYFGHTKLRILQSYSLIFIGKRCLINVAGEKTYSEFLLENGLAVKVPKRLNKEYDFLLYKSQREAKIAKIGLWDLNIQKLCTSSIYVRQ